MLDTGRNATYLEFMDDNRTLRALTSLAYIHPSDEDGNPRSMHDRRFEDVFAKWLSDFDRIRRGELDEIERECYAEPGMNPLAQWLIDEGQPRDPATYRTWTDAEATWFHVWETVSEGSPVSPAFATTEELIDHLVKYGDDWDRMRKRRGYTRAQAEAFVNAGFAPSMIVVVKDGQATSACGIAAAELMKE